MLFIIVFLQLLSTSERVHENFLSRKKEASVLPVLFFFLTEPANNERTFCQDSFSSLSGAVFLLCFLENTVGLTAGTKPHRTRFFSIQYAPREVSSSGCSLGEGWGAPGITRGGASPNTVVWRLKEGRPLSLALGCRSSLAVAGPPGRGHCPGCSGSKWMVGLASGSRLGDGVRGAVHGRSTFSTSHLGEKRVVHLHVEGWELEAQGG